MVGLNNYGARYAQGVPVAKLAGTTIYWQALRMGHELNIAAGWIEKNKVGLASQVDPV